MAECRSATSYCVYSSMGEALDVACNRKRNTQSELSANIDKVLMLANRLDLAQPSSSFIVLEGIDGSGKTTLAKEITQDTNFQLLKTPPESIAELRSSFDTCGHNDLRRAYYAIGNYVAVDAMQKIAFESPLPLKFVFDRFYFSTVSYAVASQCPTFATMPDQHHPVWKWPDDLPKPALVVLVTVSREKRRLRLAERGTLTDEEEAMRHNDTLVDKLEHAYCCCIAANTDITVIKLDSTKHTPAELRDQVLQALTAGP